jgi:hypothetical protein
MSVDCLVATAASDNVVLPFSLAFAAAARALIASMDGFSLGTDGAAGSNVD